VVLAVMLLAGLIAFAVAAWMIDGEDPLRVDGGCSNNQFGCGALTEVAATVLALALAFAVFAYWRVFRVVRAHVKCWRDAPYKLVPTATPVERVVGRDGICEMLEEDLVDPERRPQIIVGGVGDGKTAVLVRLAQRLVAAGAVPVGIRLRDAKKAPLDFEALARTEFMARVQGQFLSEDEGDKIWRKLSCDGRVVILADGLEEALSDEEEGRESIIRSALDRAVERRLPLVIASRPDEVLAGANAAVIRLEPLPTRSAIDYIRKVERHERDARADDTGDLSTLAGVAEIAERPLFLALARESYRRGGLAGIQLTDRLGLQLKLLDDWETRLREEEETYDRLSRDEREEALDGVETMACVALAVNSLEVPFETLKRSPYVKHDSEQDWARRVARGAEHLEVVKVTRGGVRFTHGITQAYLAAQQLPEHVSRRRDRLRGDIRSSVPGAERVIGPDYLDDVLDDPSREGLMALVMCCRLDAAQRVGTCLRGRLRRIALSRELGRDPVAFDVLAAAYEIDGMLNGARNARLRDAARRLWTNASRVHTSGPLREAKIRALLRMAERGTISAYQAMWDACIRERDYRVRFRAAEHLALGGDTAFRAVHPDAVLSSSGTRLIYSENLSGLRAEDVRMGYLQGWLLPLLVRSCETMADRALEALQGWIGLMDPAVSGDRNLHLGVESALAQGFKFEANRVSPSSWDGRLIDLATEFLDRAQWWYSRMTLLQACCLWALRTGGERRQWLRRRIRQAADGDSHPFVRAAAALCLDALEADEKARRAEARAAGASRILRPWRSRRADRARWRGPAHYIWIDEVGVAAKIGPRTPYWEPESATGLWISLDAGWRGLCPRARQLVADVLVDLNLVEGEAEPPDDVADRRNGSAGSMADDDRVRKRERRRLATTGERLPVCLVDATERRRLRVNTLREEAEPGELGCPDRCGMKLCPYPGPRRAPFRGDLSETFCREQMRLLSGHWKDFPRRVQRQGPLSRFVRRMKALPDWQSSSARWRPLRRRREREKLKEFWSWMEARDQR
jgi:hypothetical protein